MTSIIRKGLIACGIGAALLGAACAVGLWWIQRGGRVVERSELVGPETQAFVTFIAVPEDRALLDLFATVQQRAAARYKNQPEWLHAFADFLSGAQVSGDPGKSSALFPLRGTAMVEKPPGKEGQVVYVLSLGRKANLLRMFLGLSDSEREKETYRGERIILRAGGHDLSMSLVGNNLVLSSDPGLVRLLIDRLKTPAGGGRPSDLLAACSVGVDPSGEMPGFGAILNDRKSIATLWQMGTGAPEGAEVALPEEFVGVGFRFGVASADALRGDGYFYFEDEEAASGSKEALSSGLSQLFSHFRLEPNVALYQEGRRLRVVIEAKGVQAALDRLFLHLRAPASAR